MLFRHRNEGPFKRRLIKNHENKSFKSEDAHVNKGNHGRNGQKTN